MKKLLQIFNVVVLMVIIMSLHPATSSITDCPVAVIKVDFFFNNKKVKTFYNDSPFLERRFFSATIRPSFYSKDKFWADSIKITTK